MPDQFLARMSGWIHEGITTTSTNRPGMTLAEVEVRGSNFNEYQTPSHQGDNDTSSYNPDWLWSDGG